MMKQNELRKAVRMALSVGAIAAAGMTAPAFAQGPSNAPVTQTPAGQSQAQQQGKQFGTITVTGSRIQRVDTETANPVIRVGQQTIQLSGDLTLGQVVQELPAITGPNTNPNVNNGGGSGATRVGLRGLGANRTLVLVDGQRIISGDLNRIPLAAVERIEVLTNGASSVYGSDAIGGVINVILKSDYQGAQLRLNDGISSRGDGQRRGFSFIFGATSGKGSLIAGIDYNHTNPVLEKDRPFSAHTVSITGSTNTPVHTFFGGSSFTPRGFISLPPSLQAQFGCSAVSLNSSVVGSSRPTTLSDYHCFDKSKDTFSFSDVRPITTPQERTDGFFRGTYNITPNVGVSLTWLHNTTSSGFLLGPPVWGTFVGTSLSKDSLFNPFGVDFSGASGNAFRSRLVPAGSRFTGIRTVTDQAMFQVQGEAMVLDHPWTWNVGYNYGHISEDDSVGGLPQLPLLNPGLGPSMLVNGVPRCVSTPGDPSTVIPGCVPWDTFNLQNPASLQVQNAPGTHQPALESSISIERIEHAGFSGGLFDLPAGAVKLAFGLSRREEYTNSLVDPVLVINDAGTCTFSSQCSSPLQGGFNVKEAYAEVFIPILKDLPFVDALNIDIGDRYSKFSNFGSTDNGKIGIEYKPIHDLLLRGTVAEVFRAPTIGDIFAAPGAFGAVINTDPCDHITSPNPACVGVPLDGSFVNTQVANSQQTSVLATGSAFAHFPLGPEQGRSFDIGAVYSPHYVPGLSLSVDAWHVYLNDVITGVSGQTILNACFNGIAKFCPLIKRFGANTASAGQFDEIILPTANLGRIDVAGDDLQATYDLPQTPVGQFSVSLQGTYLDRFDLQTAPGQPGNQLIHEAGKINLDAGGGLLPHVRALGRVSWQSGPWVAAWRIQYIGPFDLGSHDPDRGFSAVPGFKGDNPFVLHYGAWVYNDVTAGYDITAINARVDIGINNVFDKQPPILFENNIGSGNANTSPNNFDPIGRFYWARLTFDF